MAKKKRHIKSLQDLEQALRIVGGVLPHTMEELDQSRRLVNDDEVTVIASKYSFEDIWEAPSPLQNTNTHVIEISDSQSEINVSWGIAARGNHEVPQNVIDQMIKNENVDDK